ncbi:MAG TPA: MMPL family transporter [Caulobacteraceae bacterium]|nr:MMPL family transporter [Caulobacteraceae bacterium]
MSQSAERPPPMARLVAFSTAHARLVVALGLVCAIAAMFFVATRFSMNTNTDDLLSPQLAYRQREIQLARAFPQMSNQIVVVIDGATPELTDQGANALAGAMARDPGLFPAVERPGGGRFWDTEGLLFEPTAQVRAQMSRLIAAEPFLGPMAADPSLRGLTSALSTALQGVSAGQAKLASLDAPMRRLSGALEALEAGRPAQFSWRALIEGGKPDPRELRQILQVTPRLDYSGLEPGRAASDAIRQWARRLNLDAAHGVRVRLTGDIPLQDEEFATLTQRAAPIAVFAFCAIVLMLWLAVRSIRVIGAILLTTLVGLVLAASLGLAVFQSFNAISIAFIPLFVGLGIDFGIQFSVRYRSEHAHGGTQAWALVEAGSRMGRPLTLAACAIAAGFLAFAPTAYFGVSQLGVIAGAGMIIALFLNLSLLPALIRLANPPPGRRGPPAVQINRLDELVLANRRRVVLASVAVGLVCAALLPLLRFDFNPLHLDSPNSEAVATLADLMKDPEQSPNTAEVLSPDLAAADALAARAARLPEVASARTLSDFVPADQPRKLAIIGDAATLLDFALNPIFEAPPPSDAEVVQSLQATAQALRQAAAAKGSAAADALRLASAMQRLAQAPAPLRTRAAKVIMTPFATVLAQVRSSLQARPVTLASLPASLVRDWISPGGRARVSISPKGDSNDNAVLDRFIRAVRRVAPDATGAAIGIREGGRTVVRAFLEAGALSFLAITALLFLVLRKVRDVAITMAPIVLTGLLTLGSCVVIGQPLNFANIIALPLLFGIGVAFHIYFVMSWRSGHAHLLTSSLARAVFFSALTTATGFGSLWLSSHPGTASMGELLMISLVWTLVSALIFQPALMGPPPAAPAP